MRSTFILVLFGVVLLSIALVARSGLFRRKNPGEPANKYMREMMNTPLSPQLSSEEAAVIDAKYPTAHVLTSGLHYIVRAPGDGGAKPRRGQEVIAHYEGRLLLDG